MNGAGEGEEMEAKLDLRHARLLAHAAELARIMRELNQADEHVLVVDDSRNGGSPYHHLDRGLIATLELLGTKNKTGFYECVTTGMDPREALDRAIEFENDWA